MMVGIVGMQLYNLGYSHGRIAGFDEGVSWLAPRMAHVEWEVKPCKEETKYAAFCTSEPDWEGINGR